MNGTKDKFDRMIRRFFLDGLKTSLKQPSRFFYFLSLLRGQKKAASRRKEMEAVGISVPPIMILSVTRKCNLACKGCYSNLLRQSGKPEMNADEIDSLLTQAEDLGIGIVMVAGGEPFLRSEVIRLLCRHKRILFPVFTNGMAVDEEMRKTLKKNPHLFPILSIEGGADQTDCRRGRGIFNRLLKISGEFHSHHIPYGLSITATSENFDEVTSDDFIRIFSRLGSLYFNYVEYVPVQKDTIGLVLSSEQQKRLVERAEDLQTRFKRLFLVFPGNEEIYGGCLAAGRGFIHVSADGSLEPCPFAPFSDTNVTRIPLKEALASRILQIIRSNHHLLTETSGGCALWSNKELVEVLTQTNQSACSRGIEPDAHPLRQSALI